MFTEEIDYVIKFENGVYDFNQKSWFLSVNKSTKCNKRSSNTCYAYLQRPCHKLVNCCNQWRLIPEDSGEYYKIAVADGIYAGHILYSFNDIKSDNRDGGSNYVFVAPEKYNNQFYKWKLNKIGDNLFTIKNKDTNGYLAAHRFYPGDSRDGQSTWMITHKD